MSAHRVHPGLTARSFKAQLLLTASAVLVLVWGVGCGQPSATDDAGTFDGGVEEQDAGASDGGPGVDAGQGDAGETDAGSDAGVTDGGPDAGLDGGASIDAGRPPNLMLRKSALPVGDLHGVTVNANQTRAYVGEGGQIAILDLGTILPAGSPNYPHPAVIAKVPVEATFLGLRLDSTGGDAALFIAGGTHGLLKMGITEPVSPCSAGDLGVTPGCFPVQTLDDVDRGLHPGADNEKYCWDVGFTQVAGHDYLLALFGAVETAAAGGTELRVYDRATSTFVLSIPITTGVSTSLGYAMAVNGTDVFLAMGTGGLVRADLSSLANGGAVALTSVKFDPAAPPAGCATPTLTVSPAENARIRDVAVTGGRVWLAADMFGLVGLDPATLAVGFCQPLEDPAVGGPQRFGLQVDALRVARTGGSTSAYVMVGGGGCVKAYEGGAPYSAVGRMSYGLGVGGEFGSCASAGTEALYVFRVSGASLVQEHFQSGVGEAGGNFVARGSPTATLDQFRIYQQLVAYDAPLLNGWAVGLKALTYSVAAAPPITAALDFAYTGRGLGAFGAFSTLHNPNFVIPYLEGSSGSATFPDYVDLADPSRPTLVSAPGTGPRPVGVLLPDAQWIDDADPSLEWFSSDAQHGWALNRFAPTLACGVDQYFLTPPQGDDCRVVRAYFGMHSYRDPVGDRERLLGLQAVTRLGAVAYDRQALVDRAAQTTPGCQLSPDAGSGSCAVADLCTNEYLFQVDTHPELANWNAAQQHVGIRNAMTWSTKTFSYDVGGGVMHEIAVIAAGFSTNNTDELINATGAAGHDGLEDDPNFSRGQLVLVDLDASPTQVPGCSSCGGAQIPVMEPIGIAYGPPKGNAFSVELVQMCGKRFAFVGDFGGRVLQFDVTNPFAPALVSHWDVPLDTLDGHYENVLDVLVDYDPAWGGLANLYFSAMRPGLVKLKLQVECTMSPEVTFPPQTWVDASVEKSDTPGLTHLLRRYEMNGKKGLIVGDKNAGLRFYGEFETSAPVSCQ